jgi:hypothetical protein
MGVWLPKASDRGDPKAGPEGYAEFPKAKDG